MAQMRIHDFEDGTPNTDTTEDTISQKSLELLRAEEMKRLNKKLMDYLEVSEERAIVLTPFRDGPLGALFTVNEAVNEDSNIDKVTIAYVRNIDNQSAIDPIYDKSMKESSDVRRARPMSIAYNGGKGEILFNSLRELRQLSEEDRQIASNVQIQSSALDSIQSQINDFEDEFLVDFGFKRDTSKTSVNIPKFPKSWQQTEEGELKRKSQALIRKLLNNKGAFTDSPLRSVELIRAVIIWNFDNNNKPLKHQDILQSLDDTYDALPGVSEWDYAKRNILTRSLLNAMVDGEIIVQNDGEQTTYEVGPNWESYSDLFDCYISYFEQEGET